MRMAKWNWTSRTALSWFSTAAHAEIDATDVVMGKLIHSFPHPGVPDLLQAEIDNWPLKAIESTQFPTGSSLRTSISKCPT